MAMRIFLPVQKLSAVVLLLFVSSGCVSQKPLPYGAVPKKMAPSGPALTVLPIEDKRTAKDDLDKMLKIPECVEVVLAQEMEGAGYFRSVNTAADGGATGYTLRVTLEDLRWEVPKYDALVGKTFGISLATGGLGGLIYASTDTPVLGHAALTMVLASSEGEVLNKRYVGAVQEERAKLSCDTPTTRREMAAKAVAEAIRQFKADLAGVEGLKGKEGETEAVALGEGAGR